MKPLPTYPSPVPHKSIRLHSRNYLGHGWYFITLCAFRRTPYFRVESVARWLLTILHAEAVRHSFVLHAYCLMPDHLHLLVHGVAPDADLLQFVKTFKHKTTFLFLKHTGKTIWQTSFYDHILRPGEEPAKVAGYIWLNPVRAHLTENPATYPYNGPPEAAWRKSVPPPATWSPPVKLHS